jgi:hypothetical protein
LEAAGNTKSSSLRNGATSGQHLLMSAHQTEAKELGGRPQIGLLAERLVGLLALTLFLAGCASTNPSAQSEPLVTLTFPGKKTEEVGMVVLEVFQKAGFELKRTGKAQLEFLRRGGTMDQAMYGGLLSGGVWERVRIQIQAVNELEQRVELVAEKVRSPGDQVFEEAHRISNTKRYEPQLAEIKQRLR